MKRSLAFTLLKLLRHEHIAAPSQVPQKTEPRALAIYWQRRVTMKQEMWHEASEVHVDASVHKQSAPHACE